MISILIPTYNYNIYDLVANIHAQISRLDISFEIIVCEDASDRFLTENRKIKELRHTEYQVLKNNIGRTSLRDLLAKKAVHNWVLFLDADVLPKNEDFIKNYIVTIKNSDSEVILGGICYKKEKPEPSKMLRWIYGVERETKPLEARNKDPYTIVSSNLLIKKDIFLETNTIDEKFYGMDNFFSNQLKRKDIKVKHIENPVIHLGLEDNKVFLKKALAAVETTVILEEKGFMDNNMRPIQKSYLKLKKYHLVNSFSFIVSRFRKTMERNFNSDNPNLFWFDLYRLNYYIQLKKEQNA
ncbi:glycosyltransferase family 2 protein [Aequorivita sinensis]|uniref:glycosyltransferase family 2 protein n=1 Tax=Aequorivita sinensis TaxID=1382458 RepID=UPI0023006403|nr:glycosyltransferase family 2 protein [Aequorivita sinensis]